jgi:hypothetical protein
MCNKDMYSDCNNDDQFHRRKYRMALCEIKILIEPHKARMDIFKEIDEVLRKCGI